MGKLIEVVINRSIQHFVDENRIVPHEQFGFKYKTSTVYVVTKLCSDVGAALSEKKFLAACLIDLQKAFDSVWLEGLMFKLIRKKCPPHLFKIIWDMITERKICISPGGVASTQYDLENGLQQGAVNSPLLFNIYINDLLSSYDLNRGENKMAIGFADDLIVYIIDKCLFKAQTELRGVFESLCGYFAAWKLKCNFEKCESIFFRPLIEKLNNKYKVVWRNFHIQPNDGTIIQHKRTVKYLGVHVDDRLKFIDHIKLALKKARNAFFKY